jgi:hypothetical protein
MFAISAINFGTHLIAITLLILLNTFIKFIMKSYTQIDKNVLFLFCIKSDIYIFVKQKKLRQF